MTEEQQLLVEFKQQLQAERRRRIADLDSHFGSPFISVWTPHLTTEMQKMRTRFLNMSLSNWSAMWWSDRGYEVQRAEDGSVGIKSKEQ